MMKLANIGRVRQLVNELGAVNEWLTVLEAHPTVATVSLALGNVDRLSMEIGRDQAHTLAWAERTRVIQQLWALGVDATDVDLLPTPVDTTRANSAAEPEGEGVSNP